MQVNKSSHNPWLWIALCLTIALVIWVNLQETSEETTEEVSSEDAVSAPVVAAKPTPTASQNAVDTTSVQTMPASSPVAAMAPTAPTSQRLSDVTADADAPREPWLRPRLVQPKATPIFTAQQWLPPPVKPPPPPPPIAPPLPFNYVGTFDDLPEGKTVLLMQQTKMLMIKVGANVNGQWRLDREDAQQVYFTYLPLNKPVALNKSAKGLAANRSNANNDNPENPDANVDPSLNL